MRNRATGSMPHPKMKLDNEVTNKEWNRMDAVLKEQEAYEGEYVARMLDGVLVLEEIDDIILDLSLDD